MITEEMLRADNQLLRRQRNEAETAHWQVVDQLRDAVVQMKQLQRELDDATRCRRRRSQQTVRIVETKEPGRVVDNNCTFRCHRGAMLLGWDGSRVYDRLAAAVFPTATAAEAFARGHGWKVSRRTCGVTPEWLRNETEAWAEALGWGGVVPGQIRWVLIDEVFRLSEPLPDDSPYDRED